MSDSLWPMDCSMPDFPALHYLPEFPQTHVHWVRNTIQPSCPLSSPSPASIIPRIRVFSKGSALCITWPKYWNFSFSISHSNDYSGLSTPFPIWNQSVVPCPILTVASWPAFRFKKCISDFQYLKWWLSWGKINYIKEQKEEHKLISFMLIIYWQNNVIYFKHQNMINNNNLFQF